MAVDHSSHDAWIARLKARADRPAARSREPLRCGAAAVAIGSIERALAEDIVRAGLPFERYENGWRIDAPVDAALERIARWLHENGLCSRWRDELLDVVADGGVVVGRIERAATRPLGLTTRAVHLIGYIAGGAVWVQQRAFDKATDPGLWDTLTGGLVAAGESIAETLERETREEAGLALEDLQGLEPCGRITVRRPVADGYMVEHIEVFEAVVPDAIEPANQDGEVERFECLAAEPLLARLRADAFTLEAALILAQRLPRWSSAVDKA